MAKAVANRVMAADQKHNQAGNALNLTAAGTASSASSALLPSAGQGAGGVRATLEERERQVKVFRDLEAAVAEGMEDVAALNSRSGGADRRGASRSRALAGEVRWGDDSSGAGGALLMSSSAPTLPTQLQTASSASSSALSANSHETSSPERPPQQQQQQFQSHPNGTHGNYSHLDPLLTPDPSTGAPWAVGRRE
jgi:hypothetical protein